MPENMKTSDVLRDKFDNFCHLCSLHGLIYLRADVQLPICDRVFWITVFVSSVLASCVVIHNVWHTWVTNPIVIVYDSTVQPIWDIPFPSVTVCSFITVKRSVLDLSSTTDEKGLFFSSLLCASSEFFENKSFSVSKEEMKTFYSFMVEASPSCPEMLRRCFWQNKEFPCCKIFFPIITDIGLCYIINSLPSEILFTPYTDKQFLFNDSYPEDTRYWAPESGYPPRGPDQPATYPKWADSYGYDSGLSVELQQDMGEWQDLCSGGYLGFKVLVNSPEEAPISAHAALRAPMRRDFLVQLSPRTIRTQPQLSSTAKRLRGCLFQSERSLDYFSTYTQNNCILECLLEVALVQCGCVPFYMPRNDSVPVCSKNTDQKCFGRVKERMVVSSMHSHLSEDKATPWCGCYPSCNEITYNYESNHGMFHKNNSYHPNSHEFAKISIYYSDLHFLGVHRQADSSFYDFLGTCGGLLGLFMGFSCISAVEVLYHLILRPLSCLALRKKNKKPNLNARPPLRHHKDYIKSYY